MKIALAAPTYPLKEAPSPPLGLCYVAAACEAAGAKAKIFDYIVRKYSFEKLEAEMREFQPDVIGATSVTMSFIPAVTIIQDAKRINPEIITFMGGPHVSFDVKNTLEKYPELDLIIIGEGEATLAELVPAIKDRKAWKDIRGIAFRENGQTVFTGSRPLIEDLDTLPLPARHLLPLSRYQQCPEDPFSTPLFFNNVPITVFAYKNQDIAFTEYSITNYCRFQRSRIKRVLTCNSCIIKTSY